MSLATEKSGEVRFKCTGCGRCCGTPPAIMIDEILKQSKSFVLGAQLRIISKIDHKDPRDLKILRMSYPELSLDNDKAVKALANHLNKIADIQGVPIEDPISDGSAPHLAFALIDVDQLSSKCPQLRRDGTCGIYETRPRKCRSVPVDEVVPETLLGESLEYEIQKMRSAGGTCEFGGPAPVIWKDGCLANEADKIVHGANGAEMSKAVGMISKEMIAEYLEFKSIESGTSQKVLANVVEQLGTEHERPIFALVPAVARLCKIGVISQERGARLLMDQAKLIKARLPSIGPNEQIEGVHGATMHRVLSDWQEMYFQVARSWMQQVVAG